MNLTKRLEIPCQICGKIYTVDILKSFNPSAYHNCIKETLNQYKDVSISTKPPKEK